MVSAFILIQVASAVGWGNTPTIHASLHAVQGVKTVHFLTGPTDIIVYVEAASHDALMEILGKIRAVKGVGSTDTRVVLPV
jgi:DNA-binding Lrp family transcriptional regulator